MNIDFVGHTPIRECGVLSSNLGGVKAYAKEEFHNLGMSSKDRTAWFMVDDAIKHKKIVDGGTFVEASSGNTGLSMAMIAKSLGYKAKIFVSRSCSVEKLAVLQSYGADIVVCNNSNGPDDRESTQFAAEEYARQHHDAYFTNQYFNPANIAAHAQTTGPEIWEQTEGKVTHFIAGVGTGGTISGVGRYLKSKNNKIQIWGVEPTHSIYSHFLEHNSLPDDPQPFDAIEGIGRTFVPASFDPTVVDKVFQVGEQDSRAAALWYKAQSGNLLGFSGAAVVAALRLHHLEMQFNRNAHVVLLFPDHGSRYITKLYEQAMITERELIIA